MKYLTTKFLGVAATIAVLSMPAAAGPSDFSDFGWYLTDNISGLEWRDVTATTGMSYDYVSSQLGSGGQFAGWSIADVSKFNQLINDFTDDSNPLNDTVAYIVQEPDKIDALVQMLGVTYQPTSTRLRTLGMLSEGPWAGAQYVAHIEDNDLNAYDQDLTCIGCNWLYSYSSAPIIGTYLYRDPNVTSPVPEPETYAMMLAGLGLLGGMARRRKACER